jgi:hypothetical protein
MPLAEIQTQIMTRWSEFRQSSEQELLSQKQELQAQNEDLQAQNEDLVAELSRLRGLVESKEDPNPTVPVVLT